MKMDFVLMGNVFAMKAMRESLIVRKNRILGAILQVLQRYWLNHNKLFKIYC